ncbi:hypothetical protein BDA96_02G103700 [Sorghum bicolor]|uniref:F-box domain-containing protein n=2 Tax=Sorghum bicolor TaxID=4558 RepID=A0A921RMM6_SORBI|nr:hypothetical protein BDA96_02G103700 [Sorghum bicolor]OQU88811.1 hypothetical protein SORBI_3002G099800 [Sorghum bicolor]
MTGVLMEELVEEVLLRFPPDDPASLVRAALVSKPWCRLIAGRGFRRRFRELHLHRAAAPMLGFICNVLGAASARLVPTLTTSCLPRADHHGWRALDSRDGLVLLCNANCSDIVEMEPFDPFVVWNPITGEHLQLPYLPLERCAPPGPFFFNATVLCAGAGSDDDACDHLDGSGHGGRFLVVFVGTYADGLFTYVYSSESGAWSEPSSMADHPHDMLDSVPAAMVGTAVHFMFKCSMRMLKFDLATRENSVQGKLGFTRAEDYKLYLWSSMEVVGGHGGVEWTRDRVIELNSLLPADALLTPPDVVGCVHGCGVVLVGTGDGFFRIDLKLNQADDDVDTGYGHCFFIVVPYTGFYFPGTYNLAYLFILPVFRI